MLEDEEEEEEEEDVASATCCFVASCVIFMDWEAKSKVKEKVSKRPSQKAENQIKKKGEKIRAYPLNANYLKTNFNIERERELHAAR